MTNQPNPAQQASDATRFRKKPVVIEASQWFKNGDHPAVVMKSDPKYRPHDDPVPWIDTLEGGHRVTPGDWIITGVKGEHYPCKPDIFAMTYEPAEAARELTAAQRVGEWVQVPTVHGWYWHWDGEVFHMRFVWERPGHSYLAVEESDPFSSKRNFRMASKMGGKWFGPLEPPSVDAALSQPIEPQGAVLGGLRVVALELRHHADHGPVQALRNIMHELADKLDALPVAVGAGESQLIGYTTHAIIDRAQKLGQCAGIWSKPEPGDVPVYAAMTPATPAGKG